MAKYRKKPVVIDAIQFNNLNYREIEEFMGQELKKQIISDTAYEAGVAPPQMGLIIPTLEGDMLASPRDYVIRGIKGEFYPCKPDIFVGSYDLVVEE